MTARALVTVRNPPRGDSPQEGLRRRRSRGNGPQVLRPVHGLGRRPRAGGRAGRAAAAHVSLGNPYAVLHLLDILRETGAYEQAATLAGRMPAAGMFDFFLKHQSSEDQFRFGQEAEGIQARPWDRDLNLWLRPLLRHADTANAAGRHRTVYQLTELRSYTRATTRWRNLGQVGRQDPDSRPVCGHASGC